MSVRAGQHGAPAADAAHRRAFELLRPRCVHGHRPALFHPRLSRAPRLRRSLGRRAENTAIYACRVALPSAPRTVARDCRVRHCVNAHGAVGRTAKGMAAGSKRGMVSATSIRFLTTMSRQKNSSAPLNVSCLLCLFLPVVPHGVWLMVFVQLGRGNDSWQRTSTRRYVALWTLLPPT